MSPQAFSSFFLFRSSALFCSAVVALLAGRACNFAVAVLLRPTGELLCWLSPSQLFSIFLCFSYFFL